LSKTIWYRTAPILTSWLGGHRNVLGFGAVATTPKIEPVYPLVAGDCADWLMNSSNSMVGGKTTVEPISTRWKSPKLALLAFPILRALVPGNERVCPKNPQLSAIEETASSQVAKILSN